MFQNQKKWDISKIKKNFHLYISCIFTVLLQSYFNKDWPLDLKVKMKRISGRGPKRYYTDVFFLKCVQATGCGTLNTNRTKRESCIYMKKRQYMSEQGHTPVVTKERDHASPPPSPLPSSLPSPILGWLGPSSRLRFEVAPL